MLKSLNQLGLPVLGGTAIVIAAAVTIANWNYGEGKIQSLETRMDEVEAARAAATEQAQVKAGRAAELEQQIAEVQAAAEARMAKGFDLTAPAPVSEGAYGLGRAALAEEVAAWDVDILPDGRGLPEGSGDVYTGEEVFLERCAACHGDFAEGADNWPVLAGGFDTLADEDPVKTVGSYWPHLSTAWDYISRSMPFGEAGTLTADETYAIVAYLLYSNDMVDDEFVLSHENFSEVDMYNMTGFVIDDRPDLEYTAWRAEPCMQNCKEEARVTMRSVFLVNTPAEGGSESVMNPGTLENIPTFSADGPSYIPAATAKPADEKKASAQPEAQQTEDVHLASVAQNAATQVDDAEMVKAGKKVFKRCKSCHEVGVGAANKVGPILNGVVDAPLGHIQGFSYSKALLAKAEKGIVWDDANLDAFLTKPKDFLKGTKMSFSGLKKEKDRRALIAYLRSVGN